MLHAVFVLALGIVGLTVTSGGEKPLEVVERVDITRYLGTWYEIARLPTRFEKNCVAATATYSLRPDGNIRVINRCRKKTLVGPLREIEGKAWVADKKTNAKLKVQFFWPFSGDYWIIELDKDYRWAVVGHPQRTYLWILCRTPQMDQALYEDLVNRVGNKGYDIALIQPTLQPEE